MQIETWRSLLEKTDWPRLTHAYDWADETPGHLLALVGEDDAAREAALRHLISALVHQGTSWPATAPAALIVAGILEDKGLANRLLPIRTKLVRFLALVAETLPGPGGPPLDRKELEDWASYDLEPMIAARDDEAMYEDQDAANALFARSLLAVRDAGPRLLRTLMTCLSDPSSSTRMQAAYGAALFAAYGFPGGVAQELIDRLLDCADRAENTDERSTHVLALGNLGVQPVQFLGDPSNAVQLCAALAPAFDTVPQVNALLIALLKDHAGEMNGWFVEKPPQLQRHPRAVVIHTIARRSRAFADYASAAVATIATTDVYASSSFDLMWAADAEWGFLLAAAFPKGDGIVESEEQRSVLKALVGSEVFWNPDYASGARRYFEKAGLPYDRDACRILCG